MPSFSRQPKLAALIDRFIKPPVFADDADKTRLARTLHYGLTALTMTLLVNLVATLLVGEQKWGGGVLILISFGVDGATIYWMRIGRVRWAAKFLAVYAWLVVSVLVYLGDGLSTIAPSLYAPVVALSLLFVGWRASVFSALGALLFTLLIFIANEMGYHPPTVFPLRGITQWTIFAMGLICMLVPFATVYDQITTALQNAREQLALREKAEAALRESEERFRLITSITSDYTFSSVIREDGLPQNTLLTGAFQDITGYTTEEYEAVGGYRATIHPDDIAEDNRILAILKTNQSVVSELRILRKDGQVRWTRANAVPIWDAVNNRLHGITGAVRDITEQKLAEQALRENEAKFHTIFELTPYGITIQKRNGVFLDANQAFLAMIGMSVEEVIGHNAVDLDIFPDPDYLRSLMRELNQHGRIVNREIVVHPRNADERSLLVSSQQITLAGEVTVLTVGVDITERKLAERALRESEERFRIISTATSDYTFASTMDEQGHIVNRMTTGAFEAISGYTPEEFTAMGGWRATVHPDDLAQDDRDLAALHQNQSIVSELRMVRKDGEVRWVRVHAVPVWDEERNRLVGINGGVRDITEHKNADSAVLALNAELRERTAYLSTLNEVARAVTTLTDLKTTLQNVFKILESVVPFDAFYIALYEQTTDQVDFPIAFDNGRFYNQNSGPLLTGTRLEYVIRGGEPLLVNRTSEELAALTRPPSPVGDSARTSASIILVPLPYRGRIIGAISTQSYTLDMYNQKHVEIIRGAAYIVAAAIENARLYEGLQQELADRKTLNDIAQAVASLSDLKSTLLTVFEQLKAVIPFDAFYVALYDAGQDVLTFPIVFESGKFYEHAPRKPDTMFGGVHALTTGQMVYKNLTQEEITAYLDSPDLMGDTTQITASLMVAPLPYRGKVIGTISTQSHAKDAYTQKHADSLRGAAYIVATAIENARLYEGLQRELADRKTLNDIAQAVASLTDLKSTLLTVFEQLKAVIPFDAFYVALYDDTRDELTFPIMFDNGKFYEQRPRNPSSTFANADVLTTGQMVYRNYTPDEIAVFADNPEMMGDPNHLTASAMVAPLPYRGKIIGTISTQSYTMNAYSQKHADSLRGAAYIVATAIENARLYEGLQRELTHRRALNEMAFAVTGLTDLNTTLRNVFQELSHVVPFDAFYVALYDADTEELTYPIMLDSGEYYDIPAHRLDPTDAFMRVITERESLLVNRTLEEIEENTSSRFLIGDTSRASASLMAVPLPYRGRIIGMVSAQSYTLNAYTQSHVDILLGAAYIVATAIENARLYEGLQQELAHRRAAEEAMRRSEAHLRALLDATTDIAFLMARDGKFLTVNRTMAATIGRPPEDLIGYNGFEFLTAGLQTERRQRFDKVSDSGLPERWEDQASNYWWDNNLYPVLSSGGEVEAFALYSRNVTEQKRLEAELQQHTARLEQMVEERTLALRGAKEQIELILHNSNDALALAQSNGDIQTRNPAFEAMFGTQVKEGVEGILETIIDDDQRRLVSHALVEAVGSQTVQRVEAHILAPDGTEKDVDLALIPVRLSDNEGGRGLLVSAHDITHFKEIERFKTRFVENALHDLGTPIAGLISRIYLLKERPDQLDQHVLKLQNQTEHLKGLLEDLRFVAELDRGQIDLQLEPVNLNHLVTRVYDTYEPIAIAQEQILQLTVDRDLPSLALDGRRMERVLVNLVSNAINYTPEGKRVMLQTSYDAAHVYFKVTDEGIGISSTDLPHIFERFYRAAHARERRAGGTGLGLAIVKEVVELHGGDVTATSEVGKGSVFTIRLPYGEHTS